MAGFLRYILSILLISVYSLTSTGFGIHKCSLDGSAEVLIVGSDRSCEEIHDHCQCNSEGCSSQKHDGECCKTELHHLDLDYDIVKSGTEISPLPSESIDYLQISWLSSSFSNSGFGYKYKEVRHGPDIPLTPDYLSLISQWRL